MICEKLELFHLHILRDPLLPDLPLDEPEEPQSLEELDELHQSPELEDPPLFPDLPEPEPLLPDLPLDDDPHQSELDDEPQSPEEPEDPPLFPDLPEPEPLLPLLPLDESLPHPPQPSGLDQPPVQIDIKIIVLMSTCWIILDDE